MGHLTNILDWLRVNTGRDTTFTAGAVETTTDFSSYTVSELRDVAKSRGLKGYSSLRKADLVNLLTS